MHSQGETGGLMGTSWVREPATLSDDRADELHSPGFLPESAPASEQRVLWTWKGQVRSGIRLATICALCDRRFRVGRWGQRGAQLPACALGCWRPSGSPLTIPQRGLQVPGWGSEGQESHRKLEL